MARGTKPTLEIIELAEISQDEKTEREKALKEVLARMLVSIYETKYE